MRHKVSIFCLSTLGLVLALPVNAIGLSAYRIYLDQDQRDATFTVYNRDTLPQNCELELRYFKFDEKGEMSTLAEDEKLPDNNAEKWVRFSPKRFVLSPVNAQSIKFTMRRKANTEPREYRSYVAIDCGIEKKKGEKSSTQLISITPKLMHNVPLIVRTGKLDAEVFFSDISVANGAVQFNINRKGNRSVFGDLQIVEKGTENVLSDLKMLSIYTESTHKSASLSLMGRSADDVQLRFVESKNFGGNIVAIQNLR